MTDRRRCKTCCHWQIDPADYEGSRMTSPTDPDTYKPMVLPFLVKQCWHPLLKFAERPAQSDGFAVLDGSDYWAGLFTGEDFGCVQHEEQPTS